MCDYRKSYNVIILVAVFLSMHVGFIETTKTEVMKFVFCTKAKSMFVEYVLPIRITLLLEKSESHDHGDLQIKP